MFRYIGKRLLTLIPLFLGVSFLTFCLGNMSAGDTARIYAERIFEHPSRDQVEAIRVELGLDKPLPARYAKWLLNAVRGDLGLSLRTDRPVSQEIAALFPKTLELAALSFILLLILVFSLGLLSAVYPGTLIDSIARAYCFLSVSMPGFWLALLLLYFFGARLGLVSVIGASGIPLLPAFTMAFSMGGIYVRMVRTNMDEVLEKGYISAARAKGVPEHLVITRHALKNALVPVLNRLGIAFSHLLAGSAITEFIFSLKGLGRYALESIRIKNFPVVQGYVLFMALAVVLINLAVDILCCFIDPRIKME
jgi:peptide/nickel transport system permease protein